MRKTKKNVSAPLKKPADAARDRRAILKLVPRLRKIKKGCR